MANRFITYFWRDTPLTTCYLFSYLRRRDELDTRTVCVYSYTYVLHYPTPTSAQAHTTDTFTCADPYQPTHTRTHTHEFKSSNIITHKVTNLADLGLTATKETTSYIACSEKSIRIIRVVKLHSGTVHPLAWSFVHLLNSLLSHKKEHTHLGSKLLPLEEVVSQEAKTSRTPTG